MFSISLIRHYQITGRLWKRHARTVIRYASIRKSCNALRSLWHFARGNTTISSKPIFLKVELSRYCTVDCTGCFPKEYRFYPFEKFKLLVDKFERYIFMAQLYEIGEPLHHPDLLKCIDYAHKKRIATVVSTTLSLKKPDIYWKELVTSGLDRLIVAIDGTTEAVYNRYRTRGDLNLVMDNLKKILHFRKESRSSLFVEWQMIDFSWNQCEQNSARKLAAELGCDTFQIIEDASELRKLAKKSKKTRDRNCIWPYVLLLVNVYDDVLPCFKPACSPGILGNLQNSSFDEIWNDQEVRRIRSRDQIKLRDGCRICNE